MDTEWEKRTKIIIYESISLIIKRDIPKAFEKMKQVISTYNAPEIMPYEQYARYIGLFGLLTLSRVQFKKSIMENFDLISVFNEDKKMSSFLNCVFQAQYSEFF